MLLRVLISILYCLILSDPARAADYRTVIVFGDTQQITLHEDPQFAEMVDWVVANKDVENIDAVLHVGDMIQDGGRLADAYDKAFEACSPGYPNVILNRDCKGCSPRIACRDACLLDPAVATCLSVCDTDPSCQNSCILGCLAECPTGYISTIPGCYDVTSAVPPTCLSCQYAVNGTVAQWEFFRSVWTGGDPSRGLKGLEDPDGRIPYMLAMGNHENQGDLSPDEIVDPTQQNERVPGYADYYGASHWQGMEASFDQPGNDRAEADRGFEYLGSFVESGNSFLDTHLSHAWRFRLGESPGPEMWVKVIGHAMERKQGAIDWAKAAMRCDASANLDPGCDPDTPSILLTHRQLITPWARPEPLWRQIIETDPTIYKGRVLLAIQGHLANLDNAHTEFLGPSTVFGMRTVNFIFNQQATLLAVPPEETDPSRWFIGAVRFWLSPDGIEDIQVVRIDPLAQPPVEPVDVRLDLPGPSYRRDWDGDGVSNWDDSCPYDAAITSEPDSDGDGWGDSCDNCPEDPNLTQNDVDRDGIGNICDPLLQVGECVVPPPGDPPADSNGDGRPDACQCGDVNGDGQITSVDLGAMSLCEGGQIGCDLSLADVTKDGALSVIDRGIVVAVVNGESPSLALRCTALTIPD